MSQEPKTSSRRPSLPSLIACSWRKNRTADETKTHDPATSRSGLLSFIQLFLAAAFIFVGSFAYNTHVQLVAVQKDYDTALNTALATIQSLNSTAMATGTCSSSIDLTEDLNDQVNFLYKENEVLQKSSKKLAQELQSVSTEYKNLVEKTKGMEEEYEDMNDQVDFLYSELDRTEKISNELREELDDDKASDQDEDEVEFLVKFLHSELEMTKTIVKELREELDDATASANDEDEVKFLHSELDRSEKISNELRQEFDDAKAGANDEDEIKFLYSELDRSQKISNELKKELADAKAGAKLLC
jgi:uncharacterized coiled-coil DUF342 family protein